MHAKMYFLFLRFLLILRTCKHFQNEIVLNWLVLSATWGLHYVSVFFQSYINSVEKRKRGQFLLWVKRNIWRLSKWKNINEVWETDCMNFGLRDFSYFLVLTVINNIYLFRSFVSSTVFAFKSSQNHSRPFRCNSIVIYGTYMTKWAILELF